MGISDSPVTSGGSSPPWRLGRFTNAWDELIVPDPVFADLRSLVERVRNPPPGSGSEGLTVLFTGEPGTGTGLATRIIAAELSRPLLEIDAAAARARGVAALATAVWRALEEASSENAIVVFAEADDLLSHQFRRRPANRGELDVLARCAHYPGLVIFRSRVSGRLPSELQERFVSIVRFPFPDAEARVRIWRTELPADAEISPDHLNFLAGSFRLAGGAIHRCCTGARRLAATAHRPVQLPDIGQALEEHYRDLLISPVTRQALDSISTGARSESPPLATEPPTGPPSDASAAPPATEPSGPAPRALVPWLRRGARRRT